MWLEPSKLENPRSNLSRFRELLQLGLSYNEYPSSGAGGFRGFCLHELVSYTLGDDGRSPYPHNSQREITRSRQDRLESAEEIIRPPLNSSETSEEIFRPFPGSSEISRLRLFTLESSEEIIRDTVVSPEESIRPRLQTFQSAEENIRLLKIAEEIIRQRRHALESAEERFRPRLHSLEITEIISPRLHTLENAEASTSSTSDSQWDIDIEQQIISNTIQDVPEKWEYLKHIVQFLAMAVAFFSIITWVDGPLRVIEAVIYLLYVSAILVQLFRLVHHRATDAGNNDAATSRSYESLFQLIARLAIVCVVFAGLNTFLYRKE